MSKDFNRHLTNEYIQIVIKHMKKSSTSYFIREMQIKAEMKYCYTTMRPIFRTLTTSNAGKDVEQ